MSNSAPNTDPNYLTKEDADIIRDMIKHENELVNQRFNWMATLQGLLLAALAFSWEKAPV